MRCSLCKQEIKNYTPEFNRFPIDEEKFSDICEACVVKFATWRGNVYAKLFPTKAMKKKFGEKK